MSNDGDWSLSPYTPAIEEVIFSQSIKKLMSCNWSPNYSPFSSLYSWANASLKIDTKWNIRESVSLYVQYYIWSVFGWMVEWKWMRMLDAWKKPLSRYLKIKWKYKTLLVICLKKKLKQKGSWIDVGEH